MKLLVIIQVLFLVITSLSLALENQPYNIPKNKQGIADRNDDLLSDERYSVLENNLSIGIQKYNYYWENAENRTSSSPRIYTCPKGYILFPENDKQKKLLNITNYHCYNKNFISKWKKRFIQNKKYHIQIAVVLWTAPKQYREDGCEGFYFSLQHRHIMGGCYPAINHYDDYEDWVRFTAYTFGAYIDHYIVWNEVDSTNWADTSSLLYSKKEMITDLDYHMKRSFDIYAALLTRTITAVEALDHDCMDRRKNCKNLVYVSLTRDWYSRIPTYHKNKSGDIHIRWRNMNLLDYLWMNLGLKYDWSIAVHPYGSVNAKIENAMTFSTLKELSAYQKAQIDSRKETKRSWLSYPQSKIFASEQNVGHRLKPNEWSKKAKFICESYNIALQMPELIAITNNHFQDNIHSRNKKPNKYAMFPASVKADLSDANRFETFQAYLSTTPNIWGKKNDHYCCKIYKLGCSH